MATIVFFHAHPDDESIGTAGSMCSAAERGHRVVLVVATNGDQGELFDGPLAEGETLADRRAAETHASAEILGVHRVVFLGYSDSGMDGWESNSAAGVFAAADLDEAAGRLAAVLREERADVLTCYDEHGGYGHPDHIQVHRVGLRAAALAGTDRVYLGTMNREEFQARMAERDALAAAAGVEPEGPPAEAAATWGTPAAELTTRVDVRPWLDRKRASMRAHASQIAADSFFLKMDDEMFAMAFGTEWYVRVDAPPGVHEDDLLTGLDDAAKPTSA